MIFISVRRLVQLFFYFIAAMALYVLYKSIGLNMMFMIAVALLSVKFAPVLFLPIILIAVGVHFTGDFSFIADGIVGTFWAIVLAPLCFIIFFDGYHPEIQKKSQKQKKK